MRKADKLLEVRGLKTQFFTPDGIIQAVDDVSFDVDYGETLGLVGESGCGKSVTALSIARLVPDPPGKIVAGQILFDGIDVLSLSNEAMRKLRGKEIGFIFQDPLTSLNPTLTIGYQIAEAIREHLGLSQKAARDRVVELLAKVGIPRPHDRLKDYPHQFSGGMRQRVMIAIALSCDPKLILADEPTTALDVTIQAQILELIQKLSEEFGTAVLLITHDLGIAAGMCDRVNVMYAGRIVETGHGRRHVREPAHAVRLGPARLAAADRRHPGGEAAHDRGNAAVADLAARRLSLWPALPIRAGHLPRGRAGADGSTGRGALRPMLGDRARRVDQLTAADGRRPCHPGARHEEHRRSRRPEGLLPDPGGHLQDDQGDRQGGRRRDLRGPPRRDARPGRRVGLWQEHDRPGHDPASRTHRRDGALRRRRPRRH